LEGNRKTAKLTSHFSEHMAGAPAFNANKPFENAPAVRCSRPASPSRPNGCRRGFRELNTAGGGTTISAARFSQPWLWRTRRSLIAGLSLPGLWRARRSADASARGDSGPARHHHGLATRVLELAQTRLGLGGPSLRLPPVPTRALDSCSLEPTIRRLGLGVRALAMKLATERSSC
jgi:hypothetical protein